MKMKKLPIVIASLAMAGAVLPTAASASSVTKTAETKANTATASASMSAAEKQRVIEHMGRNEGNVLGWGANNGKPGLHSGGAVVQGGLLNMSNPADWWKEAYFEDTDAENAAVQNEWFDIVEPWGVFMEMEGNTASTLKADVRNVQVYVLREGNSKWELLHEDKHAISWSNYFEPDMQTDMGVAAETTPIDGGNGGTTTDIQVGTGKVTHWGSNRLNNIPDPSSIKGVMVKAESRLSKDTPADAKVAFQVGTDYKYNDDDSKMGWYPGAGTSRASQLSKDWERYYFVNIDTAQDATPERSITKEEFLNTDIPLPDMNAQ